MAHLQRRQSFGTPSRRERKLEFRVLGWNCGGAWQKERVERDFTVGTLHFLVLYSSQSSQKCPSDRGKLEEGVWSSWLREEGEITSAEQGHVSPGKKLKRIEWRQNRGHLP